MSNFPAAGYISNNARTEGELKTAHEDVVASAKQLPGGSAETTLVIAAGVATPTSANHALDTEGAAATDDLTNLSQANQPDGRLVMVRSTAAGRVVVLKHGAGGAGQLQLQGAVDLALDDPGDFLVFRRDGALWTEVGRNRKADRGFIPRGYIYGYQLSNNVADFINDIDIAAGEAASDDVLSANRILLSGAGMTKRLDAVWTAGSGNGGRISNEALIDGTWNLFAFRRSGGAIDYCFSQLLNPTVPDSGTNKRFIGAIMRESGFIVGFIHDGADFFQRKAPSLYQQTNPGAALVTASLGIPWGARMRALVNLVVRDNVANRVVYVSDTQVDDLVPAGDGIPLATSSHVAGTNLWYHASQMQVRTNTTAQVKYRWDASGTSTVIRMAALGWWDPRVR